MDGVECLAHLLEARWLPADPGEDAALPARALRMQERRELPFRERLRPGMRRRGRREVWEEKLHRRAIAAALQRGQRLVRRIEAQRHIRLAARHVVDESFQLGDGALDDLGRLAARAIEPVERRLERLAEARRAGEPDHVERAAHLVQVLGAAAERPCVERRGAGARDLVAHPLERLIDLGGDPGKDGGVGHRASRGS